MPKFTFTSPEGKTYDVTGPEGATKEQAFQILQAQLGSAGAAPAAAPAQPEQSGAGFVFGNLAKGVAGTVGPYAEMARKAVNAPADIANRILDTVMGGKGTAPKVPKAAPTEVSTEALEAAGRKAGAITPSAEPRTTAQRYGAAALQALPSAALPGGGANLAGRVGGAVGAGLGGQLGSDIGGPLGAMIGSVAGGMAGGTAGAQRGIPKPPSEAAAASKRSGIPLTLGQETGSPSLRFTENRLRELFPSAGTAEKDSIRQISAGMDAVDRLATKMSGRVPAGQEAGAYKEALGRQLSQTFDATVSKLNQARKTQADADFGEVRRIAGEKPVIKFQNVLEELNQIIAENKGVASGDAKKIAKQAETIRKAISEAPAPTKIGYAGAGYQPGAHAPVPKVQTIGNAMKTRSAWGDAAARTGNIFTDIDPNLNQRMAKRLFGAVNKDFEAAGNGTGDIARALKSANQNYAKASRSLEVLQENALSKILGRDIVDDLGIGGTASTQAPEKLAQRFLAMQPSEARVVTAILKKHAPGVLDDAKATVLRNALEESRGTVPGGPEMSFAKFRTQIGKVAPKLKEMGFSAKEIADIKDVTDTMARAGDKLGANPSKTAAAASLGSIGTLALTGHVGAAAGAMLTPYVLGKALLTPEGRNLLRTVATATDGAKRAAAVGALRAMAPAASSASRQTPPDALSGAATTPAGLLQMPAPPNQ